MKNSVVFPKASPAILASVLLFCFCLLVLLPSCAAVKTSGEPWANMSSKAKATWMFEVYNSQYEDYLVALGHVKNSDGTWEKVSSPDLSQVKQQILRKKKELLVKVYPLIKLFDAAVTIGSTPSAETEKEIISLIDELLLLVEQ